MSTRCNIDSFDRHVTVGYEIVIANSAKPGWLSTISYPTRACGIIVNYNKFFCYIIPRRLSHYFTNCSIGNFCHRLNGGVLNLVTLCKKRVMD